VPPGLARYLVEKGSVAVDGVSLTVSALGGGPGQQPWFEVSLIPATLAATTLGRVQPGMSVNLEADVIGKYVERMLRGEAVSARGSAHPEPPGAPPASPFPLHSPERQAAGPHRAAVRP